MTLIYNVNVAAVPQSGNWQCSAASTAWLLSALGEPATQDDVVASLGPNRIDAAIGLHDHTGAGLVAMLADAPWSVSAANGGVSFDEAIARAQQGPMLLGGDRWDHWTGVRGTDGTLLELANPSPGWRGVGQTLDRAQFEQLGPMFAVWPTDVAMAGSGQPAPAAAVDAGAASGSPPTWALVAGGVAVAWALDLL